MTPYYDRGGIVLYNADCLDVLPLLPAQSVNLVLADLPYGTTACAWDSVIPLDALWREYKRLITPTGALVFTASQPFTSALVMSNPAWFRCEWIWEKTLASNFAVMEYHPRKLHESVLVFYQNTPTYHPQMVTGAAYTDRARARRVGIHGDAITLKSPIANDGTRYPASIIRIPNGNNDTDHPTQKPLALIEYFIRTYSNPGDLVLDNTFGSGTTPRACKNLGRRFVGMERDTTEGYCAIAADRLAQEVLPLEVA